VAHADEERGIRTLISSFNGQLRTIQVRGPPPQTSLSPRRRPVRPGARGGAIRGGGDPRGRRERWGGRRGDRGHHRDHEEAANTTPKEGGSCASPSTASSMRRAATCPSNWS